MKYCKLLLYIAIAIILTRVKIMVNLLSLDLERLERKKYMCKIAIMTDSNCGILSEQGNKLGIHIVPMPIIVDGKTYYEGIDIFTEEFYKKQAEGAEITSSLPSPGSVIDMWDELLETYDEVVYIPMSSGLSNSCGSAMTLARDYEGKVYVVDNKRISVTLVQAVLDALKMAEQGMSGADIKTTLEKEAADANIYIAVDTLEYLKKGGRITAAGAAIGSVLNIKPVLNLQEEKLDAFAKVRGMKAAFRTMCKALHKDLEVRFKELHENGELLLGMAHTYMEPEELAQWKKEFEEEFPGEEILYGVLTLSIGCHLGPGALGIGLVRKK